MNLYKKIFAKLEKADIKYLIVGGVAVNLYGYSRFTGDIDIDQLKRTKKSSPESKLEWLFSALCLGKTEKTICDSVFSTKTRIKTQKNNFQSVNIVL